MNLVNLGTFFFFSCVFMKLEYTFGDRRAYDVVQSVSEITDNIRKALIFKNLKSNLTNSIHTKKIDFDIFSRLIRSLSNGTNVKCFQDMQYIGVNIGNWNDPSKRWALQILDSFGKPSSGILNGDLKWLGDYDECKNVYAPPQNVSTAGGFHGKYCSLQVEMSILPMLPATVGVCIPETCNPSDFLQKDLISNISSALNISGFNITINSMTCKANKRQLTNGAIATICVLSILLLFAFLGSSITAIKYLTTLRPRRHSVSSNIINEETANYNKEKNYLGEDDDQLLLMEGSRTRLSVFVEGCSSFLSCFCMFTNGAKLLNTDATEGQLMCLHGIRFLSMSWVIVCHTYLSPVTVIRSLKEVLEPADNFPFQAILNGWYSVDSFFVLSGFLMAYLYFQEAAKRKGNTPWLYFYVHRYLRLTPVYMIVIAFYTTIYPYMGDGPFWPDYEIEPVCQKNWWWNMLYINNFKDSADDCMGWSWYLANDMQFFVVSPLFLITLWRWPKIGYSFLAVFVVGSWIAGFVITYHYNLIAGSLNDVTKIALDPTFMAKWLSYFDKIYGKPYTRCGPYLVGIALGYLLFKKKIINYKVKYTHLWIGWLIAIPVGLTCIYGLYHTTPTLVGASFFNALIRTAYALSLSWVIYVCLLGQGGAVDKILSYKLFIPLSRLTYCAYLIHPIILGTYFNSLKATLPFTHPTMVTVFLGLILVTYAMSLLVSLMFESPLIRLEKLVRSKFRS